MNRPAFTLRPACPDDALCLSVLALQVFLDTYALEGIRPAIAREALTTYSEAAFRQALGASDTWLWVAEAQAHLIGFAHVRLNARQFLVPDPAPAELLRLYVQQPFARRGVGRQLLARAEALAREAGAAQLWLTTWVHNRRARAFYAACGYQDLGLTQFHFEGESHDNRVLAKALGAAAE